MLKKNIKKIISSGLIIASILSTNVLSGCNTKNTVNENTSTSQQNEKNDKNSNEFKLQSFSKQPPNTKEEVVVGGVDVDTIVVKGEEKGNKIRFLLVDAPETKKPNTPVKPF